MSEPTAGSGLPPRAKWGTKRDWKPVATKVSPTDFHALEDLAHTLGTTKDAILHTALLLYLNRVRG